MGLELDTIDGFGADIGGIRSRIDRGFWLDGIDTTSLDPYGIAYAVKQALAGVGWTLGSAFPDSNFADLLLQNIVMEGVSYDGARGRLVYTTPELGFTPSVYLITRTSRPVNHTETVLPNGTLIEASLDGLEANIIPSTPVAMNFRRGAPMMIFEGLVAGDTNDTGNDYTFYANESTFRGKDKGMWLIEEYTTIRSKYTGYSQFRKVISQNILGRYHSVFSQLFNAQTGQFCKVDPADVAASLMNAYVYGQIGPNDLGFAHYGGYPTIDFASIGIPNE